MTARTDRTRTTTARAETARRAAARRGKYSPRGASMTDDAQRWTAAAGRR